MAARAEVEDQVDLDDDNYSEEIDDDLDDQLEYEAAQEGGNDDNDEDPQEEDEEQDGDDDVKSDDSGKVRLAETETSKVDEVEAEKSDHLDNENDEDKKADVSINEEDREKYDQMLALPPRGSEVFIGGLSRDISEEDLRDLCEPFGDIFEVKLVKNRDTGESKGFAFVGFKTKDVAQKAIKELHSKEFKGRTLRCSLSDTKFRLFIGNVPKTWTEDEFRKIIEETGPGSENIELIKDPLVPSRNRGFAFVEYFNNACADYSRQKMTSDTFKLDGNPPTVTWADPKSTPDQSVAASQVKALYVKNIPENTPLDELKQLFQRHGDVTKVVMPPAKVGGKRDFGFIHYAERSSALKAVKDSEKYEINDQLLEVCLAKPQNEKKFDNSNPYITAAQPHFMPHPGFGGFGLNPYANPYAPAPPLGAGYGVAAAFQQPVIFGRGAMPSGMQMVPMVLPDGQIGYVLQQPGAQLMSPPPQPPSRGRRNDWSNGSGETHSRGRSSGGSDDSYRSKRHRPSY